MAFRHERSGAFHFLLFERLAIRGVVRGVRAMFGRGGAWRITGSARKTLDVGCCVRKLMKWEEVQEEGGWAIARDARAGG